MDLSPIVGVVTFQTIALGVIAIFSAAAVVVSTYVGSRLLLDAIRGVDSAQGDDAESNDFVSDQVECGWCLGTGEPDSESEDEVCPACDGSGVVDREDAERWVRGEE